MGETGPADVQPTRTDSGAAPPPPRDTARRHAEKTLATLTATWVGKQQTAGMQKKAEQAEAKARAKVLAKKQPQSGTAGERATAEIDSSGISNATGKENRDTAAKEPSSQAAASPQQPLPSQG
ncbi:hypothetical protein COCOBI_18-2640 [Coccomyxa sp. Obi]|nr:hypothetical protein COCOBI_18-2640 [Coccomyxa sp. Obi]